MDVRKKFFWRIWLLLIPFFMLPSCVQHQGKDIKKRQTEVILSQINLLLNELNRQDFHVILEKPNTSNQIVLKNTFINEKPAKLVLDTGASSSFISKKHLKHFHLEKYDYLEGRNPTFKLAFGDKSSDTFPTLANEFRIGGLVFNSWPFVADRSSLNHGLLGIDFLCFTNAVIFCRTGLIGLSKSHRPVQNLDVMLKEFGYVEIQALVPDEFEKKGVNIKWKENGKIESLTSNVFFLPFYFEGVEGVALLDTGAPFTYIDWNLAKSRNMKISFDSALAKDIKGNIERLSVTKIKDFSIGDYRIGNQNVGVAKLFKEKKYVHLNSRTRVVGIIGFDTLINHNAIIDVGNKTIYFRR